MTMAVPHHNHQPRSLTARGFRGMSNQNDTRLPRLWRHHYSGVWIGYLLGPSDIPGHLRFEGRRVWSWSGGRLECSQLAAQGVKSGDRLGDWTTAEIAVDGSVELLPITEAIAEAARECPSS